MVAECPDYTKGSRHWRNIYPAFLILSPSPSSVELMVTDDRMVGYSHSPSTEGSSNEIFVVQCIQSSGVH